MLNIGCFFNSNLFVVVIDLSYFSFTQLYLHSFHSLNIDLEEKNSMFEHLNKQAIAMNFAFIFGLFEEILLIHRNRNGNT